MTSLGREPHYLRIGIFVISGLAILITGLIIFGSGQLFQKKIYIETYFNESIQGLNTGSPVKYRGLQIGTVDKIAFVNEIYKNHNSFKTDIYSRYIYVEMAITSNLFTHASAGALKREIAKDVQDGLRIKLSMQGLTGNAYLELNFTDPKPNQKLPFLWEPKHYYIPSATSTLNQVSDNVSHILDELQQVKLEKLFNSLQTLTLSTNSAMQKMDKLLSHTNNDLAGTTKNIQSFSEQAANYPSSLFFGAPPPKINPNTL